MKLFKKLLPILTALICSIAVIASSGCGTTQKCGGIVERYEISGKYVIITFNENKETEFYYYHCLFIYDSTFKSYNSNGLNELLSNEDFICKDRYDDTVLAKYGEGLFPAKIIEPENDTFIYLLFYNGAELILDEEFPDSYGEPFVPANYIGYIKFN